MEIYIGVRAIFDRRLVHCVIFETLSENAKNSDCLHALYNVSNCVTIFKHFETHLQCLILVVHAGDHNIKRIHFSYIVSRVH